MPGWHTSPSGLRGGALSSLSEAGDGWRSKALEGLVFSIARTAKLALGALLRTFISVLGLTRISQVTQVPRQFR